MDTRLFFLGQKREPGTEAGVSLDERLALLRAHGDFALAFSVACQPGLSYFGDRDGILAYRMVGRTAFVLADPLAPRERWGELVDAFVAHCGDVTFWQISRAMAELLVARGFTVNALGVESVIDMSGYSFAGTKRRSFRTAVNRAERAGQRVVEARLDDIDPVRVEAISRAWRETRTTARHELGFLVRPVVLEDEPGVRKFFVLDDHDQPIAFAFFDPIYRDGRVLGYLSATRRWLPEADPLSAYLMVRRAIERFSEEGALEFHLGIMPFHKIEDREFTHDWLTRRAFRFVYTNGLTNRWIYPSRSLARHKESYGGKRRPTYCAMNRHPSLPRLLKLLRACRIV
ncbi:DUF2156 domain-containing protein [Pararhizobium mangrovi]|uniref:DUF2156 domain-containing protein n=1 Tax=Pararhizobium mangrovi TaxID=2590452 RepID=A0A506U2Y3_9HYPH|nr:DUF2156 domain-containing protein [Pararhizobium mangrovi]TPW27394.1 DUF2156 domain-containing protein [Pararhizobium mangrovi]